MLGALGEARADRIARAVISAGGVLVILLVLAIVVDVVAHALPLFLPARSGAVDLAELDGAALAVGVDRRREQPWWLGENGAVTVRGAAGGRELELGVGPVVDADRAAGGLLSALAADRALVGTVRGLERWSEGRRELELEWRPAAPPVPLPGDPDWSAVTAAGDRDGNLLLAAWRTTGELLLSDWSAAARSWSERALAPRLAATSVTIADDLATLAVVAPDGRLRIFEAHAMRQLEVIGMDGQQVSTARFLVGGASLVTAGRDRSVSVLIRVPRVAVVNSTSRPVVVGDLVIEPSGTAVVPDDRLDHRLVSQPALEVVAAAPEWRLVRRLRKLPAPPTMIAAADRGRGFAVGCEDGSVALYHATSGRRLLVARWHQEPVTSIALAPLGDALMATSGRRLARSEIVNPHPEISLRTLFAPVWYEDYGAPGWTWQTTGGSDRFEPKFSIWPLLVGTLKATLYAMLFSVPLALMAAVYVSQLAPRRLQSVVKPAVELMAAVPSVVVGFLAALWLAPRLERALLTSLLAIVALPLVVLLGLICMRLLRADLRRRLPRGAELALLTAAAALVMVAVAALAGPVEGRLFGGDFGAYLFTEWGVRFEQRNALVVGLALGFAIIPVIFTIAEDACSGVPRSLVRAARALGATRWQAALRLVVPAAGPGLAAAVMLGLGRAVGETMIVLMAAGNTPILDLSAFNGMRTMSAAIAIEIPEAEVAGTLYRVLFLIGVLLFALSLVFTTGADLVGWLLRRRYARF